ncbi:MAG: hypothetical protein IJZ45_03710 [Bacteroidaceae bacterium]|nr:hypothetical protein [Bacteroidaceae bacterium]
MFLNKNLHNHLNKLFDNWMHIAHYNYYKYLYIHLYIRPYMYTSNCYHMPWMEHLLLLLSWGR